MIFRMLAVMAEFERDQVSERTKFAMAHKKACNQRVGTVPYGYDLAADGITLEPNAAEQSVIVVIDQLRAEGATLQAIADELQRRQLKTKKGNDKWAVSAVKRIVDRSKAA